MQFIDNTELIRLTNILNQLRIGSYYLSGRIEAFVSSYGTYSTNKRRHHSRRQTSTSTTASATSVEATTPSTITSGAEVDVTFATVSHMHSHLPSALPLISSDAAATSSDSLTAGRKPSPVVSIDMLKRPSRRRTSSLGDLSEPSSRALLLDFVTALNEAFPDHDFADSKIEQFKEIDTADFMRNVNACLAEVTMQLPGILEQIWAALDELIDLHVCEVFAFVPDDSDDDACANLWDFYYFLFNRELDKLIYFSCSAKSAMRKNMRDDDDMMDDDEEDDGNSVGYGVSHNTGYYAGDDSGMMDRSGLYGVPSVGSNMDADEEGYDDTQAFDDEEDGGEGQIPDWDGII